MPLHGSLRKLHLPGNLRNGFVFVIKAIYDTTASFCQKSDLSPQPFDFFVAVLQSIFVINGNLHSVDGNAFLSLSGGNISRIGVLTDAPDIALHIEDLFRPQQGKIYLLDNLRAQFLCLLIGIAFFNREAVHFLKIFRYDLICSVFFHFVLCLFAHMKFYSFLRNRAEITFHCNVSKAEACADNQLKTQKLLS